MLTEPLSRDLGRGTEKIHGKTMIPGLWAQIRDMTLLNQKQECYPVGIGARSQLFSPNFLCIDNLVKSPIAVELRLICN
jgi:hypothetical protein